MSVLAFALLVPACGGEERPTPARTATSVVDRVTRSQADEAARPVALELGARTPAEVDAYLRVVRAALEIRRAEAAYTRALDANEPSASVPAAKRMTAAAASAEGELRALRGIREHAAARRWVSSLSALAEAYDRFSRVWVEPGERSDALRDKLLDDIVAAIERSERAGLGVDLARTNSLPARRRADARADVRRRYEERVRQRER